VHRAVSVGMALLVTLVAFENLGVNTAMPRMMAELHGEALYSWPFTVFLVTSLIANVLAGRLCDAKGPAFGLYLGVSLFLAGLLVAGTASSMWTLLIGRALQGFGGGTQSIAIYVMIAYVYPERLQPAVFGLLSTAWVIPSLIGPAAAGAVTESASWRWVFLGLVPLSLLGVALLVPAVRRLPEVRPAEPAKRRLALAAVIAAVGISALAWAAEHPSVSSLVLGIAGLAVLMPALLRLFPRGTLLARPGLPVTVLARGLLAGAYTAIEVYVTLNLTAVHGYSPVAAGIPLTFGALAWSATAFLPARKVDVPRLVFVRWGLGLLGLGAAGMVVVASVGGWGWFAFVAWMTASAGMGLAYSSLSVLTIRLSAPHEQGANAASLQVSERVFSALFVGVGGVLLALLASPLHPAPAMVVLDIAMAGVAVLGVLLVRPGRVAVPGGTATR
jgi:MFS family permease